MSKVPEIFASSQGHGSEGQSQGSGGGGPVEAVFWIKDVMTQWRIAGTAFVVASDIEGDGEESSGVRTVKSEVGGRMRVLKEEGKDAWSWEKELTAHFGNCAPRMRGRYVHSIHTCFISTKNGELILGIIVSLIHHPVHPSQHL